MSPAAILVIVGVAGVMLIARLLWPRAPKKVGADTNWEQRNDERLPSLEDANDDPYDNVEKGYDIAFRGGGS
jgi:hypothetical protein